MRLFQRIKKNIAYSMIAVLVSALALCFLPASEVKAETKKEIVIVIDPGHSGSDPGKVGVNGVKEEDVNYEIAQNMVSELKKYDNVKVYLTRTEDGTNTNTGRAMVAAALRADFLICLHNNSGTENSQGAIVYTSVLPLYSTITADMGNLILNNLAALGIKNNGIQTRNSTEYAGEDYYTIMGEGMRAGVPTVLVEHCFLSNAEDSLFVSHSDGTLDYEKIAKIGKADADAVATYFNLQPRVATTDDKLTLEKGYSVKISPVTAGAGEATWVSGNKNIVSVDSNGLATAITGGTTQVSYSYPDGTSGSVTIVVNVPKQKALVGSIDPTFYKTEESMKAIDTSKVIAQMIYSDGSVVQVKPETVGTVDTKKIGIQDIPISYGLLEGSVRVIYTAPEYIPEVTSREPEPETEEETTTVLATEEESVQEDTTPTSENTTDFDIMMILKMATGIVIVIIFGTFIFLLENKLSGNKNKKRRKRY